MALIPFNLLSDVVDEWMNTAALTDGVCLVVPGANGPLCLSPTEARNVLYGRQSDVRLYGAVWKEAVQAAQRETDPAGPYRLLVVWFALPRLFRTMRKAAGRFSVELRDLESDAVLSLLECVKTIDPRQPGLDGTLVERACKELWRFARQARRERPTADIGTTATTRGFLHPSQDGPLIEEDGWALHIGLPDRPDGLSAPLRFTVSPAHAEGLRLGALAGRLGLSDVVHRARRSGEDVRVGTLSLRREEDRT
ncbi:hypothetical protein ACIQCJ_01980 [Streptomyces sp. NPDC093221]|uniref:hypothetical protein n=1 Tax=unclassified Streptomyces TaxID=2593676 RepID=UPI0033BC355B